MIKESIRIYRISQEIQKKIAIIINQKIKDPRIKMITVSEVKISSDLTYAKIFITILNILIKKNQLNMIKNTIYLLNGNMSKYISYLLSKTINLRILPKLIFFYDNSLIEGIRISNLINNTIYNKNIIL